MGLVTGERVIRLADGRSVGVRLDVGAFRMAENASGLNYFLVEQWYTPTGVDALFGAAAVRYTEEHGETDGLVPVLDMTEASELLSGSMLIVSLAMQELWTDVMGPDVGELPDESAGGNPTAAPAANPAAG